MRRLSKASSSFLDPPRTATVVDGFPGSPTKELRTQSNRVALYLQRARLIDTIRVHLRANPTRPLDHLLPSIDSFVATHALRSAPTPDSALSFFEALKQFVTSHPNSCLLSRNTLHSMATILSLSHRLPQLHSLISDMNSHQFRAILPPSSLDLLRWYASAQDLESAAKVFDGMSDEAKHKGRPHICAEAYNLMMILYAKNGHHHAAASLFLRMIDDGGYPNARTYTVVIDHLARLRKVDAAMEVFTMLPSMRVRRTSRVFLILADSLLELKRFDTIKFLLSEMQRDGIQMGQNLRSTVLKLRETGCLDETDQFVRMFEPDDRVDSLPFFIPKEEEEEEEEEEDEKKEEVGAENRRDQMSHVKPWLDPSALASAMTDWETHEVSALEEAKIVWTSRLVCKLLRAFKKPDSAWAFFCWVALQPRFSHDVYTVSRMLVILARHGRVMLVDSLVAKIQQEGIKLPISTLRLVIDFFGICKENEAATRVFCQVRSMCGNLSECDLRLLYSSLIRTLVKCKRSSEAMDYFEEMMLTGTLPDIQIVYGLTEFFALQGDFRTIQQLFGMARRCGIEPDAFLFQIVIRVYCKKKIGALALRMFDDMWARGLIPDTATKELLVKSLWKEGKHREAAYVQEKCEDVSTSLPLCVPGHVWTVSCADLQRVWELYIGNICDAS